MKKITLVLSMIMMVLILLTLSAYADNKATAFSFSPFVGGYMFEGNEDLNRISRLPVSA